MVIFVKEKIFFSFFFWKGVPVTQWLAEHATGYNSVTPEEDQVDGTENSGLKIEETCESIEYIQEIEDNNVGHAVSIDEDGSITSLPLSQLAPIQIQLESEFFF